MVKLPRVRYVTVLGAHLPNTVLGLVAATLGVTILSAVLRNPQNPSDSLFGLSPERVLQWELWRLVTWAFWEPAPIALIFGCLLIAWLGRDLSGTVGYWRFVVLYLGFAVAVGVATCLIALAVPRIRGVAYPGAWAMCDAMIIVWATVFPTRQILQFFVIPLSGRNLILFTIGVTFLLALLDFPLGFLGYIPQFVAIGFAMAWARTRVFEHLWLRFRLALARGAERRRTSGRSTLRVVQREDEKPRWYH